MSSPPPSVPWASLLGPERRRVGLSWGRVCRSVCPWAVRGPLRGSQRSVHPLVLWLLPPLAEVFASAFAELCSPPLTAGPGQALSRDLNVRKQRTAGRGQRSAPPLRSPPELPPLPFRRHPHP